MAYTLAPTTPAQVAPILSGDLSLEQLRALYTMEETHLRALIIGDKGVGKTKLLQTARKPVLHLCFDPDGEQVLFEDGPDGKAQCPKWLLPITHYTKVNVSTEPDGQNGEQAMKLFTRDFMQMKNSGVFKEIGTVCLDSLTTFGDAVLGKTLTEARRANPKHGKPMEIQDWGTFLNECTFWLKMLLSIPCDVLILGHIQQDKDEVTGRIINNVMLPGSGSQRAPILLSEVYYMLAEQPLGAANAAPKRVLVTGNDSYYKASTRLGRDGKFLLREEPDLMNLRRKAGLSTDHLPY